MPQSEERLFVITASNPDAKRHIEKSIANPIDPAIYTRFFDSTVLDELLRQSKDGKAYAWGAVPGKNNEPNWSAMQPGDHVLVYQQGRYTYWTLLLLRPIERNALFRSTVPWSDLWKTE